MDFIKWVFGFLFFHRRLLIGVLLLAALCYWLFNSKALIERFSNVKTPSGPVENIEPEPDVVPENVVPENVVPENVVTPYGDDQPAFDSIGTNDENTFGQSSTAADLVERSLEIDQRWPTETDTVAYMLISEKKRISEQLMQMDLTDFQQKFAKMSYIESVSLLDSLNVQGELQDENIRAKMIEVMTIYVDDPDEDVKSLAELVMAVYPGYDFIINPTEENLYAFRSGFDRHVDGVLLKTENARKLAEVIIRMHKTPNWKEKTKPAAVAALERYKQDTSEAGKLTYAMFEEQINFGVLDLNSLVDRMKRQDATADVHIDEFLLVLEELPDSRDEIYQIAMDVVREYIKLERKDRARDFMQQLVTSVIPKISDEQKKKKITEALDEFRPFL